MQLENNYYQILSQQTTGNQTVFQLALLPDCEIYRGHFPGHAVCPGACHIGMLKECVAKLAGKPLFIRTIRQCRFTAIASPAICPRLNLTVTYNPISDGVAITACLADGEKVYMDYKGDFEMCR